MAQLNLNMDPQEALDNINAHDHANGLGNQIITASIFNNAVTADKLATDAVTTEKIASNAVTTEKVADGSITAGKIATGVLANSGIVGLTDYIGKGAKIKPNADLSVAVEPLEASIAGAYQQTSADVNITLDARKASLIYAKKGEGGVPVLGKINAVYPEADANTVLRYTFSEVGNPQDTSGNENHVTTMVGCTRVDGWADYAKRGDGSTGYMVSGATTGFPLGAAEREVDILYTCLSVSGAQNLFAYGGSSSGTRCFLYQNGASLTIEVGGTSYYAGFDLEVGKTYFISLLYDTVNWIAYVNGVKVYSVTSSINTAAGVMYVLRNNAAAVDFSKGIVHYLELRNKMRTSAQIGQIANKLCLPCRYDTGSSSGQQYGVITGQTTAGGDATTLDKGTSYWQPTTITHYVQYSMDVARVFDSYTMGGNGGTAYAPKAWTLKVSNTGAFAGEEVTLDSQTGQTTYPAVTYNINNFTAYKYCRLYVTEVYSGVALQISKFQIYSSKSSVSTSDIREILPADSISLGLVRTNSTEVIEINDTDYKYGRREGATGGNRKVFLGWKYFSGATSLTWDNPFGTRKVKTYYVWAQDTNGRNESPAVNIWYVNGYIGIEPTPTTAQLLSIKVWEGGVTWFNNAWQTSGYIGCYAEVIE